MTGATRLVMGMTMFVLRSAFWLTIGFLLVAPHGAGDLGATASALKDQAVSAGVAAGQRLIVSQIAAADSLALPDFLLSSPSASSVTIPMQDSPALQIVVPRPRPAALG